MLRFLAVIMGTRGSGVFFDTGVFCRWKFFVGSVSFCSRVEVFCGIIFLMYSKGGASISGGLLFLRMRYCPKYTGGLVFKVLS